MLTRWQMRRGTASQWTSLNPVLLAGEMGFEIDTDRIKIGNGTTSWGGLPYSYQLTPADASEIKTLYEANADTNAYTDAEKTKLSGIAAGAEVNVQSDWTAPSGDAHILNKPTLATVATSGAYSDLSGLPSLNFEPADATILKDADIGVTVQGYSLNTVVDADYSTVKSEVTANTSARHSAVTVVDSAEIDFTLTGQQITASIVPGSIDETKLDVSVNASLDLADSATQPGDLSTVATSGAYSDLSGLPTLGTAAATASTDYATAAQGTLANTAVQPAGIANFETTTQLNARDTNNRARTNHTGTQLASTISDFTAASQAVIDNTAFVFEGGDSSTNFYPITLDMGASA